MNKNNKLIDGFLETIYAERNASKNTLLAYKRDLVAFPNFLSKKKTNKIILSKPYLMGYMKATQR